MPVQTLAYPRSPDALPQPGFLSQMMPPRACLQTEAVASPSLLRRQARPHVTPRRAGCAAAQSVPAQVGPLVPRGEGVLPEQAEGGREGAKPPTKSSVFPAGRPEERSGPGLRLDVVSPRQAGPCFRRADAVVTSQGSVEARGAAF